MASQLVPFLSGKTFSDSALTQPHPTPHDITESMSTLRIHSPSHQEEPPERSLMNRVIAILTPYAGKRINEENYNVLYGALKPIHEAWMSLRREGSSALNIDLFMNAWISTLMQIALHLQNPIHPGRPVFFPQQTLNLAQELAEFPIASSKRLSTEGKFGMQMLYELANGTRYVSKQPKESNPVSNAQRQWKNEIMILLSTPEHPNIIACLGILQPGILLPYGPEGDLFDYLSQPEINFPLTLTFFQGLACGIEHLHEHSIIHRDLKPENVLIIGPNAVIIDFGLALVLPKDQDELITPPCGTAQYLPKECCPLNHTDTVQASRAMDVWAFGCILYDALNGEGLIPTLLNNLENRIEFPAVHTLFQTLTEATISNIVSQSRSENNKDLRSPSAIEACNLIAKAALNCLKLNREERPTITQVIRDGFVNGALH